MNGDDSRLPDVTVIMPIRNERRSIAESLSAVLAQDYPPSRLQILVADGRSTDGTRDVVRRVAGGDRVTIVDNPGAIVATGLNAALACARGDIIVRVDGHTTIAPDYVRQCVDVLDRSRADNVGGVMTPRGDAWFARAVAVATSSRVGVGGSRFHYSDREEWVDSVYLGAWRRATFDRIGGFDEELVRNQDDEFNYRLRAAGGRIFLSPAIRSQYYNRSSVGSLWRQYFQYGYWKVRVMQKHPRQMSPRHLAPPALVFALAGGLLLSPFYSFPGRAWLLLVAAYGATLAGAALLHARRAARSLPGVPVALVTMHVAYGSGFLCGLVAFRDRWRAPRAGILGSDSGV